MKTNSEGWSLSEFWRRVNDRMAQLKQREAVFAEVRKPFEAGGTVESAIQTIIAEREASPPAPEVNVVRAGLKRFRQTETLGCLVTWVREVDAQDEEDAFEKFGDGEGWQVSETIGDSIKGYENDSEIEEVANPGPAPETISISRACDEPKPLNLSRRERDTIIAALQLWQRTAYEDKVDEVEIAENVREGGDDAALSDQEIDALVETRLNV